MTKLNLFEGFGLELEYMLVDAETLDVRPVADRLLSTLAGRPTSDVECGDVTWSNELTAHVIELKVTRPVSGLGGLAETFASAVTDLQPALAEMNLRLLPSGMHPWMDPSRETQLWPLEGAEIYQAFDRIFGCRAHGWANVQSTHLNLPFADEDQFARLHAAVRLVLPLLPALAASSPVVQGTPTGRMDNRLLHYARHCDRVPSLVGNVIPEPIYDSQTYRREIFDAIEKDVRPLDVDRVMDVEFLNARGAIARFDRGSIEIRLMDVQEYPAADVAICAAVVAVLKQLVDQRWLPFERQAAASSKSLRRLLDATIVDAEAAVIDDPEFLAQFGIDGRRISAGTLWRELLATINAENDAAPLLEPLKLIFEQGTLARRIANSIDGDVTPARLQHTYQRLAECLRDGRGFRL